MNPVATRVTGLRRSLMTPDPEPGFTPRKLRRTFVRMLIFMAVALLASALLHAVGLGKYLNTGWGTMLFVLVLYVPLFRFMTVDTFRPTRLTAQARPGGAARQASQNRTERRRERNRYAGVRKAPPRGGRR